jgi:nucleotide-binding universal stress UspA family protein
MIHKILFATDLTEASGPALENAVELAERLGTSIVALHAIEPVQEARPWYVPLVAQEAEVFRGVSSRQKEAAQRVLADQVGKATNGKDVEVETIVRSGVPSEVIPWLANELGVDLIVMGTHARKGLSHFMLGSIAERVVRTASCPVLTVRGPKH